MSADTSTRLRAPGSSRGGRGAHSNHRGGTTRSSKSNTSAPTIASNTSPEYSRPDISEDEGGLGSLKKKHADNLAVLKELFSDWTDEDLIFALEDRNSDLELTIEGISEGMWLLFFAIFPFHQFVSFCGKKVYILTDSHQNHRCRFQVGQSKEEIRTC